jgi:hypothetical protein
MWVLFFAIWAHAEVLPAASYRDLGPARARFELDISVALFAGSRWNRETLTTQVREIASIYAQCDLRLGKVEMFSLDIPAPAQVEGWDPEAENSSEKIAEATRLPRPTVYLIEDSLPRSSSFAKAEFKEKPKGFYPDSLLDTVWLIHAITLPDPSKRYSTAAHELGHVLLKDGMENGHRPADLMTSKSFRTNFIPPSMCEEMTANPLVRKL